MVRRRPTGLERIRRGEPCVRRLLGPQAWIALACLCFLCPGRAFADTVYTRLARSHRNVKIIAFKQARLIVLDNKTGERQTFDFERIAAIRVDGRATLNRAERFLMVKEYAKAIDAYQVALTKTSGAWEKIWIKVRLLRLLAARKQIERAAEIYVALANEIPRWVIQVAPMKREISAEPDQLRKAATRLVQARKQSTTTVSREALTRFLERLGYDQPLPEAEQRPKGEISEEELLSFRRPGVWLDTWAEKKLKAREFDLLVKITDQLFDDAVRADLPGIIYWQGRVLSATRKYDAAALRLLRVGIEFPRSKYAPYALHHAAEALARKGRVVYAQKVRRELLERYGASHDLMVLQLIDEAREKLKNTK